MCIIIGQLYEKFLYYIGKKWLSPLEFYVCCFDELVKIVILSQNYVIAEIRRFSDASKFHVLVHSWS